MSDLETELRAADGRCHRIELVSPLLVALPSLVYLALIFELGAMEGLGLAVVLGAVALVTGVVAASKRAAGAVESASPAGSDADVEAAADRVAAGRAILAAPIRMRGMPFIVAVATVALVPALMWLVGFGAWLGFERIYSLALIAIVSSLFASVIVFHWAKKTFAGARAQIAGAMHHRTRVLGSDSRLSVQQKVSLAIVLPAIASFLIVIDIVAVERGALESERALAWAALAIDEISQAEAELPLSVKIAGQLPREDFWPVRLEILEFASRPGSSDAASGLSEEFVAALDRELGQGRTTGSVDRDAGPEIGVYRSFEDGRLLVATIARADLGAGASGFGATLVTIGFGLLALVGLIGVLVSRELGHGLASLESTATRLASGDLAGSIDYASEDELGDLAHSLGALQGLMHSTVERIRATAEGAEGAVSGANAALEEVTSVSAAQAESLQHVSQMMAMINARVDEASQSAMELTATIDESGSSLLELGATGDELNQTAGVLNSKVDAVSESLEQMVGSVKQIAGTTEKLSSASEETSSSMEEMASSMRAVDISAEATANLSHEVVEKAELGQAKVVQTIAGMEAIREATDTAERVIRGLGARTGEIGGILDVIDDVADETNLLALNAAIIAAQAGEHGKAFSVVADEIKELADRVLASTKEIGGLIRAVQDESENAIGAIEAGSVSVMEGVDLSAEAGRTLEEITVASRESGTRIADIVSSVREQTNAASHVVMLMERVRESAEEIGLAGTEQDQGNEVVYQSAQAMREVSQQVRRTTEEQSRGFGRIRENVVGVRDAVDQITGSLGDQSGACRQVSESLVAVSQGTHTNEEAALKMREAIRKLAVQAESLREDAERFRV